jgi:hypothetical protein
LCPQCGADVEEQGYTIASIVRETYMRICGKVQRIAVAKCTGQVASCMTCTASVPELLAKRMKAA